MVEASPAQKHTGLFLILLISFKRYALL